MCNYYEEMLLKRKELICNKDLIWHYTSIDVGSKILDRETGLYATDFHFLNDSEEVFYGIRKVKDFIEEIKKQPDTFLKSIDYPDSSFSSLPFLSNEILGYCQESCNTLKYVHPYFVCFSHNPDSLYQWRSYTPNGGLCFGISSSEFRNHFPQTTDSFDGIFITYIPFNIRYGEKDCTFPECLIMGKCLYDEIAQKQLLIKAIKNQYEKSQNQFAQFEEKNKTGGYLIPILACILLFKHPSFAEEEEERICLWGPATFKRVKIVGGKPRIPIHCYTETYLCDAITGIFISPHGNKYHNRLLIQTLLDKNENECPVIDSSSSFVGG